MIVDQLAKVLGPTHKKGGLDQTQRILVALGMAVQSGSDSAIEWTMTRAMNHGASKEQIIDTLDVALLYGGGLAVAGVRFAYNTMRVRESLRVRRS